MDEVPGHGSLRTLRARNRLAVLQAVQANPDATRSDIARRTGLSSTTVASLVNDLLAGSVLVERDRRSKAVAGGRPAGTLWLHPELGSVVGIHLGHADTRVLIAGLDGTVRAERAEVADVDHEPQQTLQTVAHTAARLMDEVGIDPVRLFGVGVAVAAPVLGTQQLASPPMLHDWAGIDIAGQLRALIGVPVQVGNDATLGALAEWRLGAGAGADDLVYVMLSEGVGAGLVIGGRLHQGASGAAGELGHVTVVPGGQICRCGNRGCLETVVGARALVTALAHTRPNSTVDDLLRSAAAGDPGTRRLLRDAGAAVGAALAAICVVLDPQRVIVGGAAADPDGVLVEGVRSALLRGLPPVSNAGITVVGGRLGPATEALGAALLAADGAGGELVRVAAGRGAAAVRSAGDSVRVEG